MQISKVTCEKGYLKTQNCPIRHCQLNSSAVERVRQFFLFFRENLKALIGHCETSNEEFLLIFFYLLHTKKHFAFREQIILKIWSMIFDF